MFLLSKCDVETVPGSCWLQQRECEMVALSMKAIERSPFQFNAAPATAAQQGADTVHTVHTQRLRAVRRSALPAIMIRVGRFNAARDGRSQQEGRATNAGADGCSDQDSGLADLADWTRAPPGQGWTKGRNSICSLLRAQRAAPGNDAAITMPGSRLAIKGGGGTIWCDL